MNCPQCNQEMPDGSKFCTNCGAKTAEQAAAPPTAQTAVPQQPIPQQPMPPAWQTTPTAPPPQFSQPNAPTNPGGYAPPSGGVQQAVSQRNWLENLASKIPGYGGYMEKETRRDVDKIHREHLAGMLFQLKNPVNAVIRDLSNNRRLFEVNPVERILQKLDKIENRIRYASYGYRGFFDVVKIQEAQLDQLYQFDLALVNDVEAVKGRVGQLTAQAGDSNTLKAAAQELERAIDELDAKFTRRSQMIENPSLFPS